MKTYTPDDLKAHWKGKYDKWICYLNGKGEWICGNGKISGKIMTKTNKDGTEYPDLEMRDVISTGGFGLNIWSGAVKSLLGKKIR